MYNNERPHSALGRWKIITEGDLVTDKNIAKAKSLHSKIPKNAIKGDFNGDGVEEYMWVIKPKINEDNMDCIGDCVSYIQFSDPIIPSIEIENCIGGVPANEGDLNKNGGDEIGILPEWFSSCWKMYHVWTFRKGKWINTVEPFSVFCDLFEQKRKLIEIDQKKEGNVIIWYSGHTRNHTEIITKSRSVPIAR